MRLRFFCILLAGLSIISCKNRDIKYKPIGYFSSDFTLKTGAARQGILKPETKGVINLDLRYVDALSWLHEFEYIWVLSHFHTVKGWDSFVKPPKVGINLDFFLHVLQEDQTQLVYH